MSKIRTNKGIFPDIQNFTLLGGNCANRKVVEMTKTAEQVKTSATTIVVTTIVDMVARFLKLKSTTFIQLWQKTKPKMNKGKKNDGTIGVNRFIDKVYKLNCVNAVTNYNYEAMVNKARSKEAMKELEEAMISAGVPMDKIDRFFDGAKSDITDNAETFKVGVNSVGDYVDDSKCIMVNTPKTGQWTGIKGNYIQLAILNYAIPVYKWIADDAVLTNAELTEMKTFIPPKKEGARQGLAKPYVIRSPRFETIQSISLNKVNYKIG